MDALALTFVENAFDYFLALHVLSVVPERDA
jgi:hypothetical protein